MPQVEKLHDVETRLKALEVRIDDVAQRTKRAKLYLDKGYSAARVVELTGAEWKLVEALKTR